MTAEDEVVYVKMSKWQLYSVKFLKYVVIGFGVVITLGLFGIFLAGYYIGKKKALKEVGEK